MADVKPYILFLVIISTDVIVKVADVIATYLADVIAINCVRWCYYSHFNIYYDVYYLADVIGQRFWTVADVKTTLGPVCIMADVIAIVADVIATSLQLECITMVADVITTFY